MSSSTTIQKILKEVQLLDNSDRLILMERLIKMLKIEIVKSEVPNQITDLEGLGSEIWKDVNIDHYINEQRQWD
jgi:hypothetical protein